MGPTSWYVLERRANPSLRDDNDLIRLSLAEAKRERRRERNARRKNVVFATQTIGLPTQD